MAKDLFYSAGISSSDLKTGSPTVSIASGVATFSVAQTGNIGVGDEIDYDTGNTKAYIKAKTSTSVWTVTDKVGNVPPDVSGKTVNAIKRAFYGTSNRALEAAVHGSSPGAANSSHLNSKDLVSLDVKLNIVCYADGLDDSLCTVDNSWVTDSTRYINIFTPKDISTECNQTNRHDGIVDGVGYTMKSTQSTDYRRNLELNASYTKVFGLRIWRTSTNWSYGYHIGVNDYNQPSGAGRFCEVAYNLCFQETGGDDGGMIYCSNVSSDAFYGWSIHDNFNYSTASALSYGISISQDYATTTERQFKIYNNVFFGPCDTGGIRFNITNSSGSSYLPLCKNNYSKVTGASPDYSFAGNYSNASTNFAYNRSDDTTAGTSNNNGRCLIANAAFVDIVTHGDLHIQSSSSLISVGIGPGSDSNVSTIDIDGDSRSGSTCAIGADELVPSGYPRGQKGLDVPFERSNSWNNATVLSK